MPGGPIPGAALLPVQLGEAQPTAPAEGGKALLLEAVEEPGAAVEASEPSASIVAVAGSEGAASLPPSQPESLSGLVDFAGET